MNAEERAYASPLAGCCAGREKRLPSAGRLPRWRESSTPLIEPSSSGVSDSAGASRYAG